MRTKKNCTIRVRVDEDTKQILDSKASAAKMKQSEFIRQMIRNGAVNPMSNGKEIVRQVALLHEDMLNYRNDMVGRVQSLNDAVNENNNLLQQKGTQLVDGLFIREVIEAQRMRMGTIINTMMDAYFEKERSVEESLHNTLGDVGFIGG